MEISVASYYVVLVSPPLASTGRFEAVCVLDFEFGRAWATGWGHGAGARGREPEQTGWIHRAITPESVENVRKQGEQDPKRGQEWTKPDKKEQQIDNHRQEGREAQRKGTNMTETLATELRRQATKGHKRKNTEKRGTRKARGRRE